MPEQSFEIKPTGVECVCDACGIGTMVVSGNMLLSDPPKFPHVCTSCKHEEALELVQSCECSVEEAHRLVDYVFNRPVGDPPQEVGGVMVTLSALCSAHKIDLEKSAYDEADRIDTKVDEIRSKQSIKPKF